jgi:hypothetical protein
MAESLAPESRALQTPRDTPGPFSGLPVHWAAGRRDTAQGGAGVARLADRRGATSCGDGRMGQWRCRFLKRGRQAPVANELN